MSKLERLLKLTLLNYTTNLKFIQYMSIDRGDTLSAHFYCLTNFSLTI